MGYYTKRWSTLLKGPLATRFKERIEIRRVEKYGGITTKFLFREFPRLVEKEHRVTEFFKRYKEFLNAIKKVCSNCVNILFNQLTQDMTEIKAEDGIIKQLAEFWNRLPRRDDLKGIERAALLKIAAKDKEEELRDRTEYKEVEAIVIESKRRKDHEDFMDWLRTRVKQRDQLRNLLERYAWRSEVSLSGKKISSTQSLRSRLKTLLARISKETGDSRLKGLSKELQIELNYICKEISDYFRESYLTRERAILMILKVLYTAEVADKYLETNATKHNLPEQQVKDAREELKNIIVNEVGKEFNKALAQEFRIVIHKLEVEELEAERLAAAI